LKPDFLANGQSHYWLNYSGSSLLPKYLLIVQFI
jgi:hypothetical protein